MEGTHEELHSVDRLTRDLVKAARTLTDKEARYLVDYYYIMQDDRKRANSQSIAMQQEEEPMLLVSWLAEQSEKLEGQIKRALDAYTDNHVMGSWMREVYGIGPVLSAGLLAHIDITKAPTTGHIWRFAGLDPTMKWEKGQKRPWNAQLKTLCWKIGQSFMKFSNRDECWYGKLYRERKEYEVKRNEAGENANVAAEVLKSRPGHAQKAIYAEGKLPPGQIDARARRYAVKMFLSHLHDEWYRRHYKAEPPLPYPIAILGHAHIRKP